MMSKTQFIEIFHLLFLYHLEKKMERNLYALKGGCNLRFFFKSIRYSEDIDFDIQNIAKDTLTHKVEKIIESQPFIANLRSKGLEIVHHSKLKQTETTQKWKLLLKAQGLNLNIPTKIEFSRRTMNEETRFESVDTDIIRAYHLYPIQINHYPIQVSFNQKLYALINRSETQARDIFDLKLLLDQGAKVGALNFLEISFSELTRAAIDRITSIRFEEFKSQVVAYLIEEYQPQYDSTSAWNAIQDNIIQKLEGASHDFN